MGNKMDVIDKVTAILKEEYEKSVEILALAEVFTLDTLFDGWAEENAEEKAIDKLAEATGMPPEDVARLILYLFWGASTKGLIKIETLGPSPVIFEASGEFDDDCFSFAEKGAEYATLSIGINARDID